MKNQTIVKNQSGFSLIELLIVVVIIGIIAAIAIPNLLAARRAANEASAISSIKTLHGAQMVYQATAGNGNYAQMLSELRDADLIDQVLGNAVPYSNGKSGYTFYCGAVPAAAGTAATFACYSSPTVKDSVTATGTRDFGVATDGVLVTSPAQTMILNQTSSEGMQLQTSNGGAVKPLGN